jgi:hypothetical protein
MLREIQFINTQYVLFVKDFRIVVDCYKHEEGNIKFHHLYRDQEKYYERIINCTGYEDRSKESVEFNGEIFQVNDVEQGPHEISILFYDNIENKNYYDDIPYKALSRVDGQIEIKTSIFSKWLNLKLKSPTCKTKKEAVCVLEAENNDYVLDQSDEYRVMSCQYRAVQDYIAPFTLTKYRKNNRQRVEYTAVIVYDCETCVINGRHQAYMLKAELFYPNDEIDHSNDELPKFSYIQHDLTRDSSAGEEFVLWLRTEILDEWLADELQKMNRYRLRIVGFNNFRFDDTFILDALRRQHGITGTLNARFGNITNQEFFLFGVSIELCDLVKWIPDCSLKQACSDYEIVAEKMDVLIVEYNKDCQAQGQLIVTVNTIDEFMKYVSDKSIRTKLMLKKKYGRENNTRFNILEMVSDYCEMDVITTKQLYIVINDAMKSIFEEMTKRGYKLKHNDFIKYWSIPQCSMDIYKQMEIEKKNVRLVCNPSLGRFIADSYFGGRTQATFIGHAHSVGEYEYWDITSQYALAMRGFFPSVKEDGVILNPDLRMLQQSIDDCYEMRKQAKINQTLFDMTIYKELFMIKGIFRCDFSPPDEGDLITVGPIPSRIHNKSVHMAELSFPNVAQSGRILNSLHIITLLLGGWRVTLKQDNYNILFTQQEYIFEEYISMIGTLKSEAAKDDNKALKKLLKLFLTSLAGKHAQKVNNRINNQKITQNYETGMTQVDNFKYKEENWSGSLHYQGTFITGYANLIMYSTLYKLQQTNIYANYPLSFKCGSIAYMDTDSIVFDNGLCDKDKIEFNENENIGTWNEEKYEFNITWKRKYTNEKISSFIVVAKKVYFVLIKTPSGQYKIICKKMKGVHRGQIDQYSLNDIKALLDTHIGKEIRFNSLQRVAQLMPNDINILKSNYGRDFIKCITERSEKKTLTSAQDFKEQTCTNEKVLLMNKDNLEKTFYNEQLNIKNYICFISH